MKKSDIVKYLNKNKNLKYWIPIVLSGIFYFIRMISNQKTNPFPALFLAGFLYMIFEIVFSFISTDIGKILIELGFNRAPFERNDNFDPDILDNFFNTELDDNIVNIMNIAYNNFDNADNNGRDEYLFSFIFPYVHRQTNSLYNTIKTSFFNVLSRKIGEARRQNEENGDLNLIRNELVKYISLNIEYCTNSGNFCYWAYGQQFELINFIIKKGNNAVVEFFIPEDGTNGIKAKRLTSNLPTNMNFPVRICPNGHDIPRSALIQVFNDIGITRQYDPIELVHADICDELGFEFNILVDGIRCRSVYTSMTEKGEIMLVGLYENNAFNPIDPPMKRKLKTIMSNVLYRGGFEVPNNITGGPEINDIFHDYLYNNHIQAVSVNGNFEIIIKSLNNITAMENYFIKPLNMDYFIKYYKYESEFDDGYRDLNNYHDLIPNEDGYMRIPHHKIYIATGSVDDQQSWLCMLLETGSNAYGGVGGEGGFKAIQKRNLLREILSSFIINENYVNPDISDGSQGQICKATRDGTLYYLSMLNPVHIRESSVGSIANTLDIIIPPLKYHFIDRIGTIKDTITNDNLLIFVTPALVIVASTIQNADLNERLTYCLAVSQFIATLIENNILCTDLTWEDIAIYYEENGCIRCFCCDYGGYLPKPLLNDRRYSLITKPGYEAPEITNNDLRLNAEKLQVYFLGKLLKEALDGQNNIPDTIENTIKKSISENPDKRPGIGTITDAFNDVINVQGNNNG